MKWAGPGQRKSQNGKSSLISASPARNQILSSARDFDFCLHRFLHVPFPLFSALARSIPHSLGASFHLDGLRTDFSFGLHRGGLVSGLLIFVMAARDSAALRVVADQQRNKY